MSRPTLFEPARTTPARLLLGALVIALWMLMLWSSLTALAQAPVRERARTVAAGAIARAAPALPGHPL